MNYYLVLGVPCDADSETIHDAFRTLARRYHPDAGEGSSTEKFRQVVDAYETLSDPSLRRRYDESLEAARRPTPIWEPVTEVPVEPLRAPFASGARASAFASAGWPTSTLDELFEEMFRWVEDAFFFDAW